MEKFNLERAKTYEENKIPSFKLYYRLVNKKLFYSILSLEAALILTANLFIPGEMSKVFFICIALYALTCIFGIVVNFKAPIALRPGFDFDTKKITLIRFSNILIIPFTLAFFVFITTSLVTILVAFLITKNIMGNIYASHIHVFINTALIFMSTWLLFYVFHIYSDRELGKYVSAKKKLLAEGKSIKDILQVQEESGKLNVKISAYNKFTFGCKVINDNLSNLAIRLRTAPTKYILFYAVAMFSLVMIGGTCLFAGVSVYFQESRLEPAAFLIGIVCFGIAFAVKFFCSKKKDMLFDSSKGCIISEDLPEVRFSEVKELKWEKDYLEYLGMQIPFFRLYVLTDTQKIEVFRASATDEIVKEDARKGIAKVLNLVS